MREIDQMCKSQIRNPKSAIRNPVGVTLIEVVVATAIMGLVVTVIYAVLQSGILGWRTGELRFDVQQNLRLGLDRLSRELRETDAATIYFEDNTNSLSPLMGDKVLAFKSARKIDEPNTFVLGSDFSPSWQVYILYYLTQENDPVGPYVLRRRVFTLNSPDEPLTSVLTRYGYSSLSNASDRGNASSPARIIARRISNFVATPNSDNTVDIILEGVGRVPNLPLQTLVLTVRIGPRN